jgi:hypothetical protein
MKVAIGTTRYNEVHPHKDSDIVLPVSSRSSRKLVTA